MITRFLLRRIVRWRVGVSLLAVSSLAAQSQFSGSVPQGALSPQPIKLSLRDAIARGLKANLGVLTSNTADDSARGERLRTLSALLPHLEAGGGETVQQINLETIGFNLHIPGVYIPQIAGPFHYTDVRAYASWEAYNYSTRRNHDVSKERERAAQLSVSDARDLVVQAAANAYLQITSDAARIEATQAQVDTAQALYKRTDDQKIAGTAAAIDVLRSQVELKRQQQLLLAEKNRLEKDKLVLARVIGLPNGQEFSPGESVTFAPLGSLTLEEALHTAAAQRADFQSQQARVRAAEEGVKAARGERYPTANLTANYGDVGRTLADSHGTFQVVASARVNLFDGHRIEGDIVQAQAELKQRQNELADLNGMIDQQIRAAFLDIGTAADQVTVARDNLDLSNQTLAQARDRFAAGVTDNIEVVEAQQSVAFANETLISALYAHNVAKVGLARALGGAEQGIQRLLEVK
jgi:outer membrane protein TolC